MKQSREPRNSPMHIWSVDFQQQFQVISMHKGVFQINGAEQLDIHLKNDYPWPIVCSVCKKLTQNES